MTLLCLLLGPSLPPATVLGTATCCVLLNLAALCGWWRGHAGGRPPSPAFLRGHALADGMVWGGFALAGIWLADAPPAWPVLGVLLALLVAVHVLLDGWPRVAHPFVVLTVGGTTVALLLADPRPPIPATLLTLALGGALLQAGLRTHENRLRAWRSPLPAQ